MFFLLFKKIIEYIFLNKIIYINNLNFYSFELISNNIFTNIYLNYNYQNFDTIYLFLIVNFHN